MRDPLESLRSHRFLLLFMAQLIMAVTQPLAGMLVGGQATHDTIMSFMIFAVVMAVFERQRERLIALGLAIPAVVTRWSLHVVHGDATRPLAVAHHVAIVVFLSYAVFAILRRIFEERTVRADHLMGTVCGYLLAGAAWGNAYSAIAIVSPESFRIAPEIVATITTDHDRAVAFNYFSLSTLTSAGFGDILPTAAPATTLTWLEATFGQFYIALVVAQLVGLRLAQGMRSEHRES
jgi:hypothetical protein